jgi:hypothetical protein
MPALKSKSHDSSEARALPATSARSSRVVRINDRLGGQARPGEAQPGMRYGRSDSDVRCRGGEVRF